MSIAAILFLTGAALAAASDLRSRKVTNRLNLAIVLTGLGWRAAFLDLGTAAAGLAGVGVGLGVLLIPFSIRWIGAGDVKLLAAFGAWLGPYDVLLAGLIGLAGGGVLAALLALAGGAAVRKSVARNVSASIMTMTAPIAPRRVQSLVVPMAVPLAAAAIAVFLARGY
jgi:prepilin peptidase CpaA